MIKTTKYEFLKNKIIAYAWNNETHDIICFTDGTQISFKQGYCYVGNDHEMEVNKCQK
jgi:hypothetical protein